MNDAMKANPAIFISWAGVSALRTEAVCWAGGLAFTFALFFAMANLERVEHRETVAEIEEVPLSALPLDPPPPPPVTETVAADEPMPLTGIEATSSDSPVKIAAVPPDLAALIPEPRIPPKALVEIGRFRPELKPTIDAGLDARRVYQQSEVDQRPRAVVRAAPLVPPEMFGKAKTLRVEFLLVIDVKGRVESTRVLTSSGNPAFDDLVAQTVKNEWVFSAAVKRGRPVRCLAQQAFRVNLPGATPFNVE